jgi:thioredoxin 2
LLDLRNTVIIMTSRTATITCQHCGQINRLPVAAKGTPRCAKCHQPLPWIVDAGDADFAEIAQQAALPVLVDLWAEWCGPCRQVSPVLGRLAQERAGKVKLVKVDVDHAPALSQRYDVRAIPTLLVLHAGEVIARQTGAAPANVLGDWLDRALSSVGSSARKAGT